MLRLLTFYFYSFPYILSKSQWNLKPFLKHAAQLTITSTIFITPVAYFPVYQSVLAADEGINTVQVVESNPKSETFSEFLSALDGGEVARVVFNGINPQSLTAYYKSGVVFAVGSDQGFPAYNDPLSPSGPAQVIARVQHTPGVVCEQDVSDAMRKSVTRAKSGWSRRPMLQHSAYPSEYAK